MESNNDDDFILTKKIFLPALFSQNKFHFCPLRKYISQTINLILFSCQEIMSFNNEYFTRNVDLSYFLQKSNNKKYMTLLFKSKLLYKTYFLKNKLEMNFKPNKHEFDKILRMEICIGKVGRKVLNRSYESGLESREEF